MYCYHSSIIQKKERKHRLVSKKWYLFYKASHKFRQMTTNIIFNKHFASLFRVNHKISTQKHCENFKFYTTRFFIKFQKCHMFFYHTKIYKYVTIADSPKNGKRFLMY